MPIIVAMETQEVPLLWDLKIQGEYFAGSLLQVRVPSRNELRFFLRSPDSGLASQVNGRADCGFGVRLMTRVMRLGNSPDCVLWPHTYHGHAALGEQFAVAWLARPTCI